jgi:hypothetical protein
MIGQSGTIQTLIGQNMNKINERPERVKGNEPMAALSAFQ